jgi:MFS family permease
MLYKPTATAAVADAAPAGYQARYQSLYAGASVSGTVLAPPVGGALFATHPALLWFGSGLVPLALALTLALRRERATDVRITVAAGRPAGGPEGGIR